MSATIPTTPDTLTTMTKPQTPDTKAPAAAATAAASDAKAKEDRFAGFVTNFVYPVAAAAFVGVLAYAGYSIDGSIDDTNDRIDRLDARVDKLSEDMVRVITILETRLPADPPPE